jgi:hypothetical protein
VEVFASELTFVELLAAILINDMPLVGNCVPAVTVNAAGLLVDVEALSCLHENWFTVLVIKVAHQVMRVEVMFLDAERCRDFSALVKVLNCEHWLVGQVLDNIVGLGVGQVATVVDWVPLFVVFSTVLIFKYNNVSFIVSV